jgi:glycosyltransferase involved in cell wall biosynthesis
MDAVYLARDTAYDVDVWSGSPHWLGRSLAAAGFNLTYVCPLRGRAPLYYKLKGALIRRLGWGYSSDGEFPMLRAYAREAEERVRGAPARVILSCGKMNLTFLKTDLPMIFFDDASVPAISRTHPGHTNFLPSIKRRLLFMEKTSLERCLYACYASHWAADAALETYGRHLEKKIKVVPFGANMEVPRKAPDIERLIEKRMRDGCFRLLFVGRCWETKGGPIALEAAAELHRRGLPVRLDVVGCTPPGPLPDFARAHGFVSKKTAEGKAFLDELYEQSHLLIVPTRFEAYGLVYVEASSWGMPSLGSAVGGVMTIVRNGANGQNLDLNAPGAAYADVAEGWLKDPARYAALCRSSFQEYENRLSWTRFGQTIRELAYSAIA